jgi:RNA polymerase sigma factor for flagellar operon FliA
MDAAAYYAGHLQEINQAIGIICRKHGLAGDDEKDFTQHVHLQLIEDDYRKIREYRGSSSFKTFLYTVISRIHIDRVRTKWHPSTEAKRLGPAAVELEKLVYRNNYTVHEACQILAANPATALNEQTAHELLAKLRVRSPRLIRAEDSEEQLSCVRDPAPDPEERIAHQQRLQKKQKVVAVIGAQLQSFSGEDKLLIKLIFISGHKISEIARLLERDERMLYRRTQTLLRSMREAMAAAGIGESDAREMFEAIGLSHD